MKRLALLVPVFLMLLYPRPQTAFADWAWFKDDGTGWQASFNGQRFTLPSGFDLIFRHQFLLDGDVFFEITERNANGPIWVGGIMPGSQWSDWEGYVGWFDHWTYPGDVGHEPMGYATVLVGNDMRLLAGERIATHRGPDGEVVYIGQMIIPEFLTAWFAGEPEADFNADGQNTVQDIFLYLEDYFAR